MTLLLLSRPPDRLGEEEEEEPTDEASDQPSDTTIAFTPARSPRLSCTNLGFCF